MAGHLADLTVTPRSEDRHRRAIDRWRDRGGQTLAREGALDAVPLELHAHEAPGGTAACLLPPECQPADEVAGLEIDQPAHRQLVGRVVLLGIQRVSRRRVVDLEQHQARLEPDHVER